MRVGLAQRESSAHAHRPPVWQALRAASLWTSNRNATGQEVRSFTMLSIITDGHEIFGPLHKPQDEKRMVVILPDDQYGATG